MEKITREQENIRDKRIANLAPYMYKKGQSGNPSGRPEGISMKEYVRMKFRKMSDEEREEYLEGVDKKVIWEMAEDKAKQGTDITTGGEKLTPLLVKFIDEGTGN